MGLRRRVSPVSPIARRLGYCFPSASEEMLLAAALLHGPEAATAWDEWFAGGRLGRVEIGERRLLPAVYSNLVRQGVDRPELGVLRGIHRHDWYRNQRLFGAAARLIALLEDAGIPTLVLKGAALAVAHYRDSGSRPMGDVDVAVAPEHAAAAVALARDSGWAPDPPPVRDMLAVRHAWSFRDGADGHVDLHWRVMAYAHGDEHGLWQAAVPMTLVSARTRALCATDELLLACVHGLGSNPVSPVRWVLDVAALAPRADWERLCSTAARHRVSHAVAAALRYVRAAFLPTIPRYVLERLEAVPTTRFERRSYQAMTARPGSIVRALVIHRAAYRALRTAPVPGTPRLAFSDFLVQRWELDRVSEVPLFAARRLASRHRSRRRRSAALAMRA